MNIDLNDKKIAILGFGKEGQATLAYFNEHSIPVAAVLDAKENTDPELLNELKSKNITYVGGVNYLQSLNQFDVIFRSPGIPRLHPNLMKFTNQDLIYSHTKLFFDLCPCPIVAVTGTKGKTTTASLIHHILTKSGKDAYLGGNIGVPPLSFLSKLTADSVVVLELSSFQTQDLNTSPTVGVILNISEDHMGDGSFKAATHQNFNEYRQAKLQLIANQGHNDRAIIHPDLIPLAQSKGQGVKLAFDSTTVKTWKRQIPGDHNLQNISAAALACQAVGLTESQIKAGVESFTGVSQRLEIVGIINNVSYINDSASTNPDSTIAAIKSYDAPVILIVGGSDKNLDYSRLGNTIVTHKNIKAVIVIGEIANTIMSAISEYSGPVLTGAQNMSQIFDQINTLAIPGDTVLFSPGAASFDMFKNSKARGEEFNKHVELNV